MITDDPGTPGNGKWENNFAITFEHRPFETGYEVPAIDLNYGIGEHIQLTLQTAPVLLKRSGHGLLHEIARHRLHWRFNHPAHLCDRIASDLAVAKINLE